MSKKLEIKYAGFFTRLLVFVLDVIMVHYLLWVLFYLFPAPNIIIASIISFCVWWFYTSIAISLFKTTLGGKIVGIEVVRADFEPLSFIRSLIRVFLSTIPFLLYLFATIIVSLMIRNSSSILHRLPELIFLLPPLILYLTQKQQMLHDLLIKSVVIDKQKGSIFAQPKVNIVSFGQTMIRAVGIMGFVIFIAYFWIHQGVYKKYSVVQDTLYSTTFFYRYAVNDYHDPTIVFYNKEIEKSSAQFVDAKSMSDIFEANVKRNLARNCLLYSIKKHDKRNWIRIGENFQKNAINRYADTYAKIQNAISNEKHIRSNFHLYLYDYGEVTTIERSIADTLDKKINQKSCDILLSVDEMYDIFLPKYVAKYTYNQTVSQIKGKEISQEKYEAKEEFLHLQKRIILEY